MKRNITAYKTSKTIKIDDDTALTILCALYEAERRYNEVGCNSLARSVVEIRDILSDAYHSINPDTI